MASAAVALVLACSHRLRERDRALHDGRLGRRGASPRRGSGLTGRTLGVIGYGRIGREVVRLLAPWEMDVLVTQRTPVAEDGVTYVPLETLLAESDVVVVACPLTDETRGLLDARRLGLMKPTALPRQRRARRDRRPARARRGAARGTPRRRGARRRRPRAAARRRSAARAPERRRRAALARLHGRARPRLRRVAPARRCCRRPPVAFPPSRQPRRRSTTRSSPRSSPASPPDQEDAMTMTARAPQAAARLRRAPSPEMRALRAGPVTMLLDGVDLRYLRIGGTELVRRVYAAVRDVDWDTVPGVVSGLEVEQRDGELPGRVRRPPRTAARSTSAGTARSPATRADASRSSSTGARRRDSRTTGSASASTTRGARRTARPLPRPHARRRARRGVPRSDRPAGDRRRRVPRAVPGVRPARGRARRPAARCCSSSRATCGRRRTTATGPTRTSRRTRRRSRSAARAARGRAGTAPAARGHADRRAGGRRVGGAACGSRSARRPARACLPIGLGRDRDGHAPDDREAQLLGALAPAHLRVEVRLDRDDWRDALAAAQETAARSDRALEVSLHCSARSMRTSSLPWRRRSPAGRPSPGCSSRSRAARTATPAETTPAELVDARPGRRSASVLPGGARSSAARRSTSRRSTARGRSTRPGTASATRSRRRSTRSPTSTSMENLDAQARDRAKRARDRGREAVASRPSRCAAASTSTPPATRRPTRPGELPDSVDVRQSSLFGAAWTAGSLKYLAESGRVVGHVLRDDGLARRGRARRGLRAARSAFRSVAGEAFPLYHPLADATEWEGAEVLACESSDLLAGRDGLAVRLRRRRRTAARRQRDPGRAGGGRRTARRAGSALRRLERVDGGRGRRADPARFRAARRAGAGGRRARAHADALRGGAGRPGVARAGRRCTLPTARRAMPVRHGLHRGAGAQHEAVPPAGGGELRADGRAARRRPARERQRRDMREAEQEACTARRRGRLDRVRTLGERRLDRDRREEQQVDLGKRLADDVRPRARRSSSSASSSSALEPGGQREPPARALLEQLRPRRQRLRGRRRAPRLDQAAARLRRGLPAREARPPRATRRALRARRRRRGRSDATAGSERVDERLDDPDAQARSRRRRLELERPVDRVGSPGRSRRSPRARRGRRRRRARAARPCRATRLTGCTPRFETAP